MRLISHFYYLSITRQQLVNDINDCRPFLDNSSKCQTHHQSISCMEFFLLNFANCSRVPCLKWWVDPDDDLDKSCDDYDFRMTDKLHFCFQSSLPRPQWFFTTNWTLWTPRAYKGDLIRTRLLGYSSAYLDEL